MCYFLFNLLWKNEGAWIKQWNVSFSFLNLLQFIIPWPVTEIEGYVNTLIMTARYTTSSAHGLICLLGPADGQTTVHLRTNGLMSLGDWGPGIQSLWYGYYTQIWAFLPLFIFHKLHFTCVKSICTRTMDSLITSHLFAIVLFWKCCLLKFL